MLLPEACELYPPAKELFPDAVVFLPMAEAFVPVGLHPLYWTCAWICRVRQETMSPKSIVFLIVDFIIN